MGAHLLGQLQRFTESMLTLLLDAVLPDLSVFMRPSDPRSGWVSGCHGDRVTAVGPLTQKYGA